MCFFMYYVVCFYPCLQSKFPLGDNKVEIEIEINIAKTQSQDLY